MLSLSIQVTTPSMELRTLRTSHGWTQRRLADAIGVSGPFLSQVEHGHRSLPVPRAVQIGRALGLAGDDLALAVGRLVIAGAVTDAP